jgi:hypothetical protein
MQARTTKVEQCLYKRVVCFRNPKMAQTGHRQDLSLPNTCSYESLLSYLQFLGTVTALVDLQTFNYSKLSAEDYDHQTGVYPNNLCWQKFIKILYHLLSFLFFHYDFP